MEKNETMMALPIFKHFDETQITKQVDKFRTGEKGLFWFIKLGALIGVGYALWVYVIPVVFSAIAQALAMATTAIIVVGLVIAAPVILKGLRRLTRALHKMVIRHDPFAELESQKQKMLQNQVNFRTAKGKISDLKSEMEISAAENEKLGIKLQGEILKIKNKATAIKSRMEELITKEGIAAKGSDEYVNLHAEFVSVTSSSDRVAHQLTQAKTHTSKYGTRAAILKKFSHKLLMIGVQMDNKVLDFDTTIEILKKDYEFAQKSKEATQSAKDAMLFGKEWELEYALETVTNTIAEDIARTAGNLSDIDSLTANYSMDSDDLYLNLENLGNSIEAGKDIIPSAKSYSGEGVILTQEDRNNSGGFTQLFD